MRKNKILILALLVCLSIPVRAQNTDNNIIGIVVDKSGNPVYGASVNVEAAQRFGMQAIYFEDAAQYERELRKIVINS
jgi:hypothetical protein